MRAVLIREFGDPCNLQVQEVPDPVLQPDMAIVGISSASINPSDLKNVQGAMKQTTLPRIPGRDYAGVVEAGPEEWIGQEVWGSGGDAGFTRDGTHAQKIAVPVASLRAKPTRLSLDEAASIGVNFLAAWCSVVEAARLQANETLAIIGSSGGVGGAASQLAKRIGARVIGIDRIGPPKDAPIRAIPDDLILSPSDVGAAIRDITLGRGADVIFDTVGGVMFRSALSGLAVGGRMVEISSTGTREVSFDLVDFYHNESRLFGVDTLKRDSVETAKVMEALFPAFESGELRCAPIAQTYALNTAPEAYKRVAEGTAGRIVLRPQEWI